MREPTEASLQSLRRLARGMVRGEGGAEDLGRGPAPAIPAVTWPPAGCAADSASRAPVPDHAELKAICAEIDARLDQMTHAAVSR